MPEPKPMSWVEADELWGILTQPCHQNASEEVKYHVSYIVSAIALARQEKERADTIGVTMTWEEARQWLSLGYDKPGPALCRADLFRAIALARQEEKRAEKAKEMLADLQNWEINYTVLKEKADKLAGAVEDTMAIEGYLRPQLEDALCAYRDIDSAK